MLSFVGDHLQDFRAFGKDRWLPVGRHPLRIDWPWPAALRPATAREPAARRRRRPSRRTSITWSPGATRSARGRSASPGPRSKNVETYTLHVWNEVDVKVFEQSGITATTVPWPEGLDLPFGTYFWAVIAQRDGQPIAESGLSAFVITE